VTHSDGREKTIRSADHLSVNVHLLIRTSPRSRCSAVQMSGMAGYLLSAIPSHETKNNGSHLMGTSLKILPTWLIIAACTSSCCFRKTVVVQIKRTESQLDLFSLAYGVVFVGPLQDEEGLFPPSVF
jgi:hypothetical protein